MSDEPNFEGAYDIFRGLNEVAVKRLRDMEREYRKAAVVGNLYEHDGVKIVVGILEKRIVQCNHNLQEDKKKESESAQDFLRRRDTYFTERECWQFLIHLFTRAKSKTKSIKKTVDQTLKENG